MSEAGLDIGGAVPDGRDEVFSMASIRYLEEVVIQPWRQAAMDLGALDAANTQGDPQEYHVGYRNIDQGLLAAMPLLLEATEKRLKAWELAQVLEKRGPCAVFGWDADDSVARTEDQ